MPDSYDGHDTTVTDNVAMNNRSRLRGSGLTFEGWSGGARRCYRRNTSIAGTLGQDVALPEDTTMVRPLFAETVCTLQKGI